MTLSAPSVIHREYALTPDTIADAPTVTVWEDGQIRIPGPAETDRIVRELLGLPQLTVG